MRQAGRNDENTIFCFVNDPSAPISVSVFFQWQRFTDSLIRSLRRLNDAALQPACFCFTPGVFFGTHQKAALHYPNQPKPGSLCSGSVRIIVRIPFRKRKPSRFIGRESGTAVFTDQGIFALRNIHANDLICRKLKFPSPSRRRFTSYRYFWCSNRTWLLPHFLQKRRKVLPRSEWTTRCPPAVSSSSSSVSNSGSNLFFHPSSYLQSS